LHFNEFINYLKIEIHLITARAPVTIVPPSGGAAYDKVTACCDTVTKIYTF